jgi:hypothetical protein
MDCRTFHRKLEDYLEGGMDFPARFGMERHARQCYACEKDVNEALKLRQKVRAVPRVVAPADFEKLLLARIKSEKSRHRFGRLQSIWLYGFDGFSARAVVPVAAALVLLVATAAYFQFGTGWTESAMSRIGVLNPFHGDSNRGGTTELMPPGQLPGNAGSSAAGVSPLHFGTANLGMAGYFRQDFWATPYSEPGDVEYHEYLVPVSGERQLILQLPYPKTIRLRYDQPSESYFMWNVSH